MSVVSLFFLYDSLACHALNFKTSKLCCVWLLLIKSKVKSTVMSQDKIVTVSTTQIRQCPMGLWLLRERAMMAQLMSATLHIASFVPSTALLLCSVCLRQVSQAQLRFWKRGNALLPFYFHALAASLAILLTTTCASLLQLLQLWRETSRNTSHPLQMKSVCFAWDVIMSSPRSLTLATLRMKFKDFWNLNLLGSDTTVETRLISRDLLNSKQAHEQGKVQNIGSYNEVNHFGHT